MQELDRFDGLENKFHYSEKCLYLQGEINGYGQEDYTDHTIESR